MLAARQLHALQCAQRLRLRRAATRGDSDSDSDSDSKGEKADASAIAIGFAARASDEVMSGRRRRDADGEVPRSAAMSSSAAARQGIRGTRNAALRRGKETNGGTRRDAREAACAGGT